MSDYDFLAPPPEPPRPPLSPVRLKPGERPPTSIDPAVEFLLLTGRGPYRFSGLRGRVSAPLVIRSEVTLSGNLKGEGCGLLIDDGCSDLRVEDVKATGNLHGIRVRGSERVHLLRCDSSRNAIEGIILGRGTRCTVEKCRMHENGRVRGTRLLAAQAQRYAEMVAEEDAARAAVGLAPKAAVMQGAYGAAPHPSDMSHGGYDSFGGEGNLWLECDVRGNTGLGIHICSPADERVPPMQNIALRRVILRGNGSGGSGNGDANNLRGLLIEESLLEGGVGGLSTWDDAAGDPRKGAKQVVIRRSTILNERWALRLEQGGEVAVESCIVAGPASKDASSRLTWDSASRRGSVSEAAAWLEPETLRSLLPGVGWSPG